MVDDGEHVCVDAGGAAEQHAGGPAQVCQGVLYS